MKTLTFLLATVIELYTMIMLLRVWMQWARCDFYNPFSQFVVKVTQPVVGPLRRIIPAMGPIDSSSLLIAFILCVVKAIVLFMVVTFQPIIWISALLILIKTVGLLIFWVLLLMAGWYERRWQQTGDRQFITLADETWCQLDKE